MPARVNHSTDHNNVEPALEEMRELMYSSKLAIAAIIPSCSRNCAPITVMRISWIVKQRDDLVSALRYAIMMKRSVSRSPNVTAWLRNMPYAVTVEIVAVSRRCSRIDDWSLT